MPDLYGAASGFQQYNQDQSQLATAALGRQDTAQIMQERQLDIDQKKQNLIRQKTLMDALQSSAEGQPQGQPGSQNPLEQMESQSAAMFSTADLLRKKGFPEEAMKMEKEGASLAQKRAQIVASETQTQERQIQTALKDSELASKLLGSVTDEQSWHDAALQYAQATGNKSYLGMPYNPAVVAKLANQSMTQVQKAQLQLQTMRTNAVVDGEAAREQNNKHSQYVADQKLEIYRSAEARREKAGGKPVTAPNKNERDMARKELGVQVPGLTGSEAEYAAMYVASKAKQILRDNVAIDPAEAMARATDEYKKSGDFITTGKGAKSQTTFRPGAGNNPSVPLPMPSSKDGLQAGKFYQTPRGLATWDGKQFTAAKPGSGAPVSMPDDDEEEED